MTLLSKSEKRKPDFICVTPISQSSLSLLQKSKQNSTCRVTCSARQRSDRPSPFTLFSVQGYGLALALNLTHHAGYLVWRPRLPRQLFEHCCQRRQIS